MNFPYLRYAMQDGEIVIGPWCRLILQDQSAKSTSMV